MLGSHSRVHDILLLQYKIRVQNQASIFFLSCLLAHTKKAEKWHSHTNRADFSPRFLFSRGQKEKLKARTTSSPHFCTNWTPCAVAELQESLGHRIANQTLLSPPPLFLQHLYSLRWLVWEHMHNFKALNPFSITFAEIRHLASTHTQCVRTAYFLARGLPTFWVQQTRYSMLQIPPSVL